MKNDRVIELATRREQGIILCPLEARDAPSLFATVDAEREHLRAWLPWLDHNTRLVDSEAFAATAELQNAKNNAIHCAMWAGSCLAGMISVENLECNGLSATMGYWIAATYQGQGIVPSAVESMCDLAVSELGTRIITLSIATKNVRSRRVAEKTRFRFSRVEMEKEWLYDHYVDHAVYVRDFR